MIMLSNNDKLIDVRFVLGRSVQYLRNLYEESGGYDGIDRYESNQIIYDVKKKIKRLLTVNDDALIVCDLLNSKSSISDEIILTPPPDALECCRLVGSEEKPKIVLSNLIADCGQTCSIHLHPIQGSAHIKNVMC